MTERDPVLAPFDALIGAWATKATHPFVDAVVPGSVTFEWLEGGHQDDLKVTYRRRD
jgi:hypothetical protein